MLDGSGFKNKKGEHRRLPTIDDPKTKPTSSFSLPLKKARPRCGFRPEPAGTGGCPQGCSTRKHMRLRERGGARCSREGGGHPWTRPNKSGDHLDRHVCAGVLHLAPAILIRNPLRNEKGTKRGMGKKGGRSFWARKYLPW